jgi:hypothetical protein
MRRQLTRADFEDLIICLWVEVSQQKLSQFTGMLRDGLKSRTRALSSVGKRLTHCQMQCFYSDVLDIDPDITSPPFHDVDTDGTAVEKWLSIWCFFDLLRASRMRGFNLVFSPTYPYNSLVMKSLSAALEPVVGEAEWDNTANVAVTLALVPLPLGHPLADAITQSAPRRP